MIAIYVVTYFPHYTNFSSKVNPTLKHQSVVRSLKRAEILAPEEVDQVSEKDRL